MMSTNSKFLFDTAFDEELAIGGRGMKSAAALASANASGDGQPSHKALDRAFQQGVAQQQRTIEAELATASSAIAASLTELITDQVRLLESHRKESIALAATIARKLAPALTSRHPMTEIEAMISDCLRQLPSEPRIAVRATQDVIDQLKPRIESLAAHAGATGKMILIVDGALQPGDCRVEWAEGAVERREFEILAEIDAAIMRFMQRTE